MQVKKIKPRRGLAQARRAATRAEDDNSMAARHAHVVQHELCNAVVEVVVTARGGFGVQRHDGNVGLDRTIALELAANAKLLTEKKQRMNEKTWTRWESHSTQHTRTFRKQTCRSFLMPRTAVWNCLVHHFHKYRGNRRTSAEDDRPNPGSRTSSTTLITLHF